MTFHLSVPVRNLDISRRFYVDVLKATVSHIDESGYLNLDLYGAQVTLHHQPSMPAPLASMHFGVNLPTGKFLELAENITRLASDAIAVPATVVDQGTDRERHKMFLRDPDGYQIELKGMRT